MATKATTWSTWQTNSWENLVDSGQSTVVYARDTEGSAKFTFTTKSSSGTEYGRKSGAGDTWETIFAVPAGAKVTKLQVTAWKKKLVANTKLSSHTVTIGFINDSAARVTAADSLSAATLPTTPTESSFSSGTAGSLVNVNTAAQASNTNVRLSLEYSVVTGGSGSACSVDQRFDDVTVTVTYELILTADNSSFSWSPQNAGLRAARKLAAGNSSFSWTPQNAGGKKGYKGVSANSSFSWTPQAAGGKRTYVLDAENSSFSYNPQTAGSKRTYKLAAENSSFTWTPQNAGSKRALKLVAGNSSFTWTPQDAELIYTPASASAPSAASSYTKRWQYQALAAPMFIPEVISIDKWRPRFPSQLLRKAAMIAAIAAGSCFFVDIPRAEEVQIDKWQPTYPDRLDPKTRPYYLGISVTDPYQLGQAEQITYDKFKPTYPDRLDPARRLWYQGWSVVDPYQLTLPEQTSYDRYKPEYPDRLHARVRSDYHDYGGLFQIEPILQAEVVTSDKWKPEYPDRLDPAKRPFWSGWTTTDSFINFDMLEIPTVDMWYAQTSEPVRPLPRVQEGTSVLLRVTAPSMEEWRQPVSQPVLPPQRPFWSGQFVIDPFAITQAEYVDLTKWYIQNADPARWKDYSASPFFVRYVPPPPVPPLPPEKEHKKDIPLRAWRPLPEVPVLPKARVREGVFEPYTIEPILSPPEIEVTLDKWYQLPNQPYITSKHPVEYGWIVIDPGAYATPERVDLDKWYAAIVQPYIVPVFPVEHGIIAVDPYILTLQEQISLDKWYLPIVQPYLKTAVLVEQGWIANYPEPLPPELITLDRWYVRNPDFAYGLRNWNYLYPTSVADADISHVPPSPFLAAIASDDELVNELSAIDYTVDSIRDHITLEARISIHDARRE